jgi:hypothetical protein
LHEFDEFDLGRIGAFAQGRALDFIRLPPWFRPFPPRPVEFVPQRLEAGEPRQQRPALGAKFRKILQPRRDRIGPEFLERRSQRAPFQGGYRRVIDQFALPQLGNGAAPAGEGTGGKLGNSFDVDIERVEKQPAIRRVGAAIAGSVIEQSVQRVETDPVRSQLPRKLDQLFEVGKIPHPPVTRRADTIELDGEQPAAVEVAGKRPRGDDQRRFLADPCGIGEMQPVGALGQIRRPGDDAITGFTLRDNLNIGNDFPMHRQHGSLPQFGPRRPAGTDHHRLANKPVRRRARQGFEDDFEGGRARHMPVTLTVNKFGLDSPLFGFGEKVHSARGLHTTLNGRCEILLMQE